MYSNKSVKEEYISVKNILKHVSEFDIYRYYLPDIQVDKVMSSPFRDDDNPSFGIFYGKYGDLAFNDYKLGGGKFLKFVMMMENVDFKSALHILNKRYNLGYISFGDNSKINHNPVITNKNPVKKEKSAIRIKSRKWNQDDINFWYPLDINKLYNVTPIQFFWIDDTIYNAAKLSYAYRYGEGIYKIYQPELIVGKWWSNIDVNIPWFGHDNLDLTKDELIVTSSAKDTNVILQCGFNSISPHTESQIFTVKQYEYYSKLFKKIIIFYDNDETGLLKAEKFSTAYNLDYIALEEESTKDPFEFIKEYDLETLKEWMIQWI